MQFASPQAFYLLFLIPVLLAGAVAGPLYQFLGG